jgi:hypothetical protein
LKTSGEDGSPSAAKPHVRSRRISIPTEDEPAQKRSYSNFDVLLAEYFAKNSGGLGRIGLFVDDFYLNIIFVVVLFLFVFVLVRCCVSTTSKVEKSS